MLILCAGMFRSASTWQYQIALELASLSQRSFKPHGVYPFDRLRVLVPQAMEDRTIHLLKTHVPDPALEAYFDHPGFRVLYSYRDIRDVVYSMMHKTASNFRMAIDRWSVVRSCLMADRLWPRAKHVVEQRYSLWIHNPLPWVHRIAELMQIPITDLQAGALVKKYELSEQKQRALQFAMQLQERGMDLSDPRNAIMPHPQHLLHWNHIREGRVGHWRDLATAHEKLELHKLCGDWLIQRGYEPDSAWAFDALPPGKAFT